MASLTDDLRYLSRTGYRDPWAEATNNITDSLFQLANTKYQRDTLLAQIQNREEEREYQRSRDTKLDAIQEEERAYRRAQDKLEREDDDKDEFFRTYKLFDNDPESRRDLINTPEALKYFNEVNAAYQRLFQEQGSVIANQFLNNRVSQDLHRFKEMFKTKKISFFQLRLKNHSLKDKMIIGKKILKICRK